MEKNTSVVPSVTVEPSIVFDSAEGNQLISQRILMAKASASANQYHPHGPALLCKNWHPDQEAWQAERA